MELGGEKDGGFGMTNNWYVEVKRNLTQGCEVVANSVEEAIDKVRTGCEDFDFDICSQSQQHFEVIEVIAIEDDEWSLEDNETDI